jgi:glycosyltransferase involved in cell wall biosynthesis
MALDERKIVVITPIRNEEWIIREFLLAASVFADHIVIGDHLSMDRSIEIALEFPKVTVFKSETTGFSERERRNELLIEARKFGDQNVILSLDADELLSPNFVAEDHIKHLRQLKPGTRIRIPFFNIKPGLVFYWRVPQDPIGFIDDGSMHEHSSDIHFPRIPFVASKPIYELENSGLLHLQFIDWRRMESKHRWYRAWERVNFPDKPALEIARRYSHMYAVPRRNLVRTSDTWYSYYAELGIDIENLTRPQEKYWWDSETVALVDKYGEGLFRWVDLRPLKPISYKTRRDWAFWTYLKFTTPLTGLGKYSLIRISVRILDFALRKCWP